MFIAIVIILASWVILAGYIYHTWDGSQYNPDLDVEVETFDPATKAFYSFWFVPILLYVLITALPFLLRNRIKE